MAGKKSDYWLSKSTFIRGVQCEKSLYLHKHRPFLRDRLSEIQRAKFNRGSYIGQLAQGLFPGGKDASPPTHFQMKKSVEQSRQWMEEGVGVIYEAAFEHQGVVIALDILEKTGQGWKAYEVKSSREISDTYLWDAALQGWVMQGAGIAVESFNLIHINPDFVLEDEVDAQKLFVKADVTEEVKARQAEVEEKVQYFQKVLQLKNSPRVAVGEQCHYPYPCDFIGHCWKNAGPDDVLFLPGIDEKERFELHHQGLAVPQSPSVISRAALHGRSLGIPMVWEGLKAHLECMKNGDFYFLNYLWTAPGVPLFKNTRPFEKIPVAAVLMKFEQGHQKECFSWEIPAAGGHPESFGEFIHAHYQGGLPVYTFEQGHLCEILKRFLPQHADEEQLNTFCKNLNPVFDWFKNEKILALQSMDTSDVVAFYKSIGLVEAKEKLPFRVERSFEFWMQSLEGNNAEGVNIQLSKIVNNECELITGLLDWLSAVYDKCGWFGEA